MYLGEPVAQIYLVDNGVLVVTVDKEARDKARKEAEKKAPKGGACCPSTIDWDSYEKRLAFPNIKDAAKYLSRELPTLASGLKGKDAYNAAFDEGEDS